MIPNAVHVTAKWFIEHKSFYLSIDLRISWIESGLFVAILMKFTRFYAQQLKFIESWIVSCYAKAHSHSRCVFWITYGLDVVCQMQLSFTKPHRILTWSNFMMNECMYVMWQYCQCCEFYFTLFKLIFIPFHWWIKCSK